MEHDQAAIKWIIKYHKTLRKETANKHREIYPTYDREAKFHKQALRWYTSLYTSYNAKYQRTLQPARPAHYYAWLCIHQYEGSWTDAGAPYYGGLQMDWSFMASYGGSLLRSKGTADHWTPMEQMAVAEVAYNSGRGFTPWPNTARSCGLL